MRSHMVDAEPARAHVRQLVEAGMRQSNICRAAHVTGAALQILLHGHYTPSRPQQQTIHITTAARLMAVRFEPRPSPNDPEVLCRPSEWEPIGYKVGRCLDCGQIAPVRRQYNRVTLISHPRPDINDDAAAAA